MRRSRVAIASAARRRDQPIGNRLVDNVGIGLVHQLGRASQRHQPLARTRIGVEPGIDVVLLGAVELAV